MINFTITEEHLNSSIKQVEKTRCYRANCCVVATAIKRSRRKGESVVVGTAKYKDSGIHIGSREFLHTEDTRLIVNMFDNEEYDELRKKLPQQITLIEK